RAELSRRLRPGTGFSEGSVKREGQAKTGTFFAGSVARAWVPQRLGNRTRRRGIKKAQCGKSPTRSPRRRWRGTRDRGEICPNKKPIAFVGLPLLLDLEVELLDQCAPLAFFALDVGGVLLRRAGHRSTAIGDQAHFHVIGVDDLVQLLVEALDNRGRCA